MLTSDHTVLPATHTFIHKFTPQPQSVTALYPVLISRPAEGKTLNWSLDPDVYVGLFSIRSGLRSGFFVKNENVKRKTVIHE